jgi:hypothetical protein
VSIDIQFVVACTQYSLTIPKENITAKKDSSIQLRKPFRNALDKLERKEFDEMWDIPRLYISACSNSVQLVPLHPIIISILFQHYKELKECISEIYQIEDQVNSSKKKEEERLTIEEEEEEKGEGSAAVAVVLPILLSTELELFLLQSGKML